MPIQIYHAATRGRFEENRNFGLRRPGTENSDSKNIVAPLLSSREKAASIIFFAHRCGHFYFYIWG
jgi:hypothetical protein